MIRCSWAHFLKHQIWGMEMTALEYMEKQFNKHCDTYVREVNRGAPTKDVDNILAKVVYYATAVEALKKVGAGNR